MKSKVLVILGPTASGKSDLAVKLAKKFKGEIISADSRQVYRGLDIGTGKITKKEMRGIPHHLIDVTNPKKSFSVAEYKTLAESSLKNIRGKNKLPIIVGGTGFYIDVLAGNVRLPKIGPNKKLRGKLEKKSAQTLFKILQSKDPRRAKTIDPHNKVRLIRALEIVEALGKVPRLRNKPSRNFIYIGLKPDNLHERIERRLRKRLDGIITESKDLIKQKKITYKRMHELGLEYRYTTLRLQGKISKAEMFEKLHTAIRQYVKRQMTWFKRNRNIKWFKPNEFMKIEKYVRIALANGKRN